jgi:hypothetical protein
MSLKRTTYEIATVGTPPGRDTETGYVLGDFATRAPRKGEFFWRFTHLPTGMGVNVYPCHSTKASALAHLALLAAGKAPQNLTLEVTLARFGRGWGGT